MKSTANYPIAQTKRLLPLSPHRLISLWEMKEFVTKQFCGALDTLKAQTDLFSNRSQDESRSADNIRRLIRNVDAIERFAEQLELTVTKNRCNTLGCTPALGLKLATGTWTIERLIDEATK